MKRMTINQQANKEMKSYCFEHGIETCELMLPGCQRNYLLSYHHRHKRWDYYGVPVSWLWDRNQWVLCCYNCHARMEYDRKLNKEIFDKLRGEDLFTSKAIA